jgi:hypothetical protein
MTIANKFNLKSSFSDKASSDPVAQIAAEILDAALVCAFHLESIAPREDQPSSVIFALAGEFAATFSCLALDLMPITEHREALRGKLLMLFPEDIANTFLARESEYSDCSEVFVPDKPLSGDGVVNKMALHVAALCGSSFNPEILRQSAVIFASVSRELNLKELVLACL